MQYIFSWFKNHNYKMWYCDDMIYLHDAHCTQNTREIYTRVSRDYVQILYLIQRLIALRIYISKWWTATTTAYNYRSLWNLIYKYRQTQKNLLYSTTPMQSVTLVFEWVYTLSAENKKLRRVKKRNYVNSLFKYKNNI